MEDDSGAPVGTTDETQPEEEHKKKLEFFLTMLDDDNEAVRWKAAESLGRLGDPAAVDSLIDMLWDDDARVRIKAAWALGKIGDLKALRPLQQLYRIENENVREIIEKAMDELKRHD